MDDWMVGWIDECTNGASGCDNWIARDNIDQRITTKNEHN